MWYSNERLRKASLSYTGVAIGAGLMFGGPLIVLWMAYIMPPISSDSPPLAFLILASLVIVSAIVSSLYAAVVMCLEVHADHTGLKVKTGFLQSYFIPWEDVVETVSWNHVSQFNPCGDTTFVMTRSGLAFWHYAPVRTAEGHIKFAQGIILMESGENYKEINSYIKGKVRQ